MSSQAAAVEFLSLEFCKSFGSVFEQITGQTYALNRSGNEAPGDQGDALEYVLEFSGKISGKMLIGVKLHAAAILATRFMDTPVDGSIAYLPEHEDAIFEIVSQTAGLMATSLRTSFGSAEIAATRKQEVLGSATVAIVFEAANRADPVSLQVLCEQSLIDAIVASLAPEESSTAPAPAPAAAPAPDNDAERQNLRLIMDVELDLTLRFGQRTLILSEIADLTPGSVVELDRVVDEPVELMLGERVIARGEVVIVDGNYGLRVTELGAIDQHSLLSA